MMIETHKGGDMTTVEKSARGFTLTPVELPKKVTRYKDIVEEFERSDMDSALVGGPDLDKVTTGTLVASLTAAKKGKPIAVRKVDGKVYLQRKE
jgi:hypothetical protein